MNSSYFSLILFQTSGPISYQFAKLQLNKRYSGRANAVISEIHNTLSKLRKLRGGKEVKKHLTEEATNRTEYNKNSWDSALYTCLSTNTRFCDISWSLE